MDLLPILKDKVEPGYLDDSEDVKDTRVSKRTKVFRLQVEKGVKEMEDSLCYVSGRKYSKEHMPKGKSKRGGSYKREIRDSSKVPESRIQILKFLKEQNKELKNFIQETEEKPVNEVEEVTEEDDDNVEELELAEETLMESEEDNEEELLEEIETIM